MAFAVLKITAVLTPKIEGPKEIASSDFLRNAAPCEKIYKKGCDFNQIKLFLNAMEACACGSQQNYTDCCGRYLENFKSAKAPTPRTAEELMRSRYTAFTKAKIDYLYETCAPEARNDFDEKATQHWASQSKWLGLKILRTEKGGPEDNRGFVEFTATFSLDGQEHVHHEIADFHRSKENNKWYFFDGKPPKTQPLTRDSEKVGRNDPCPCGSGKKYKKCHANA